MFLEPMDGSIHHFSREEILFAGKVLNICVISPPPARAPNLDILYPIRYRIVGRQRWFPEVNFMATNNLGTLERLQITVACLLPVMVVVGHNTGRIALHLKQLRE